MQLQFKPLYKIGISFLLLLVASCNSSKTVVQSENKPRAKVTKLPVKVAAKPKVVAVKPRVSSENKGQSSTNSSKVEDSQTLEATSKVKVTNTMVLDYISNFKSIAKTDMVKYGIPASITLAQGILESGAGTGPLSVQANNHFGIKCHKDWTGPSVNYDDDSAQECFRKYNNPNESYNDHSLFLANRPRYALLFQFAKNDYAAWAKGLKDAGYATDVNYPSKLIGLIERYQLNKYDDEVLNNDLNEVIKNTATGKSVTQVQGSNVTINPRYHIVIKGDTLYSLSKKYAISIETLKQKNTISESGISIGQTLILE